MNSSKAIIAINNYWLNSLALTLCGNHCSLFNHNINIY